MSRRLPPHIVLPNGMWRFIKRGSSRVARAGRSSRRRVRSVARKKGHRRSARGLLGGLMSKNNLIGTIGGAFLARYAGVSPRLGAAAGAYFYGKSGLVGAGVGYVAAPMVTGMIDKTIGPQLTSLGFGTSPYGA